MAIMRMIPGDEAKDEAVSCAALTGRRIGGSAAVRTLEIRNVLQVSAYINRALAFTLTMDQTLDVALRDFDGNILSSSLFDGSPSVCCHSNHLRIF
jgi:hypothetical protein